VDKCILNETYLAIKRIQSWCLWVGIGFFMLSLVFQGMGLFEQQSTITNLGLFSIVSGPIIRVSYVFYVFLRQFKKVAIANAVVLVHIMLIVYQMIYQG